MYHDRSHILFWVQFGKSLIHFRLERDLHLQGETAAFLRVKKGGRKSGKFDDGKMDVWKIGLYVTFPSFVEVIGLIQSFHCECVNFWGSKYQLDQIYAFTECISCMLVIWTFPAPSVQGWACSEQTAVRRLSGVASWTGRWLLRRHQAAKRVYLKWAKTSTWFFVCQRIFFWQVTNWRSDIPNSFIGDALRRPGGQW